MMNRQWLSLLAISCTASFLLVGCGNNPKEPEPPDLPPAQGAALWSYLTDQNYQQEWPLWPGRGRLYTGTEPHGMLLTTYVNQIAAEALASGAARMPAGSIIVKENYTPEGELAAITTMYKVNGFNPAASDWFWMANSPTGQIEMEGPVNMCISCHAGANDFDYVWLWKQDAS